MQQRSGSLNCRLCVSVCVCVRCVFQNLLLPGRGHTVPLRPGLPGECTSTASVRRVHGCVWVSLSVIKTECLSLSTLSPGTFWPWTAATGSASTSLTSRGTSRYVDGNFYHPFKSAVSASPSSRLNPLRFCRRAEWWRTSQSAAAAS